MQGILKGNIAGANTRSLSHLIFCYGNVLKTQHDLRTAQSNNVPTRLVYN